MAGCGVLDTTPTPEIMYKHAQVAQKQPQKKKKKKNCFPFYLIVYTYLKSYLYYMKITEYAVK